MEGRVLDNGFGACINLHYSHYSFRLISSYQLVDPQIEHIIYRRQLSRQGRLVIKIPEPRLQVFIALG